MAAATLAELRTATPGSESAMAGSISAQPDGWKQQTVGDFFARCNWENLAVPVPTVVLDADPAIAFDYNRSVGQFFGAIPWAGGAVASAIAVQAPAAALPRAEEFGLNESAVEELPDLEEIADESHLDGGEVTLDDFLGSFSL